MRKEEYLDILENVFYPWSRRMFGRSFVFQQDNDPKHTAGVVKEWFDRKRVHKMDWPSQSPDLNPIESLWHILQTALKGKTAKNADEKFVQLQQAWQNIPVSTLTSLVGSMPRRCAAVIKARGYATKY